jgi:phosphoribosylanthranilate isomerase
MSCIVENGTTTIKICGVRTPEVVRALRSLPVAHVGFVFARSKRQVTPQQAGELIRALRGDSDSGTAPEASSAPVAALKRPLAVGVFVDPTLDELAAVLAVAPLDVFQLHGSEPPELCAAVRDRFGVRVFKAATIARDSRHVPTDDEVARQLDRYKGVVDAILLDTHDPVYGGGSGTTFAWECIPPYQRWARTTGVQLLVAGGLTPDNVASLVADYRPDGVDVSSGVETDGAKDLTKIADFVERVTHYDRTSA